MTRPSLILLHGALGSMEQFESWTDHLIFDFNLHKFSFEGHGGNIYQNRPFRIEHFAENLEDTIKDLKLAPANVFGYSMGGYVALYLALERPGLIGKIFTLATKFDWNAESAKREAGFLDPAFIREKSPGFAKTLEKRHTGMGWEKHLAATAEMMVHLGSDPPLNPERISKISIPVRIGLGDRDTMVSLSETGEYFRALPNAQLSVLPSTPHPIEKVNPERIAEEIKDFFLNS